MSTIDAPTVTLPVIPRPLTTLRERYAYRGRRRKRPADPVQHRHDTVTVTVVMCVLLACVGALTAAMAVL